MHKYKYKYKYGFAGPGRTDGEEAQLCKKEGFILQEVPAEGVLGKPIPHYESTRFYELPDAKGDFFKLFPGESTPYVGERWNDKVSSMVVALENAVLLTVDANYKGEHFIFGNEYIKNGLVFNIPPEITSFAVLPLPRQFTSVSSDFTRPKKVYSEDISLRKRDEFVCQEKIPAAGVLGEPIANYEDSHFYRYKNQNGDYFTLFPGESTPYVGDRWNDVVSSMLVAPKNAVLRTVDVNYKGSSDIVSNLSSSEELTSNIPFGTSSFAVLPLPI
jgi:hypothetical protein